MKACAVIPHFAKIAPVKITRFFDVIVPEFLRKTPPAAKATTAS